MTLKISYQIPTLKLTAATAKDPNQLYQALVDYGNDIQSFLQRLASASNQNFAADDKSILALQTEDTTQDANITALQGLKPSIIGANGMLTLPNGIILQWMSGTGNNPGVANNLPTAFPNNIYAAFSQASGAAVALETALTSKSTVTVTTAAAGVQNCFIFAIGN